MEYDPKLYPTCVSLAEGGFAAPDFLAESHYDFPCPRGQEPLPGQVEVMRHMLLYPRSFVLSDTRTGKTRPAIWSCDWLQTHCRERIRALVISDILALEKTWASEIKLCLLGRRKASMLSGTAAQRVKHLDADADFYLVNPEGMKIPAVKEAILARPDIKIVIADEATTYRNSQTDVSRAARAIARDKIWVWALTGTPNPNGPLDAYGLKKLVHPWLGLSFVQWREMCTSQHGPFLRIPRPNAPELVAGLLSPAIRVPRAAVFEETELSLPAPMMAPLSEQQIYYMKELKKELLLELASGGRISAVNQAALRSKLLQIAVGAVYDEDGGIHPIDAAPRFALLDKLVKSNTGKMLILAPFIHTVNLLAICYPINALHMRSDLTRKNKVALLKEFTKSDEKTILVSHPAVIARGIDLTVADTIIWFSPVDRTEHWLQTNQRTNGPEQTATRKIFRISGSSIENEIYSRLERNESLQNVVLKLKEWKDG